MSIFKVFQKFYIENKNAKVVFLNRLRITRKTGKLEKKLTFTVIFLWEKHTSTLVYLISRITF